MDHETTRAPRRVLRHLAGLRLRHPGAVAALAVVPVVCALAAGSAASAAPARSAHAQAPAAHAQAPAARAQAAQAPAAPAEAKPVRFATEIQWGGSDAPWHADADLVLVVSNRVGVLGQSVPAAGTQISWSGPNGSANITFFDNGRFTGSAQFPNEGPVGYRGTVKN